MKLDTAGDTVEHLASRGTLHLLQMLAMLMGSIGWGLTKAGPTITAGATKLSDFVDSRLHSHDNGDARAGNSGTDKSHIVGDPEVSRAGIDSAPEPEAQPGKGVKGKVQINQLSTGTGKAEEKEVTVADKTDPTEETFDDLPDVPTKESSSTDENGSMPGSAKAAAAESP